MNEKFTYQVFGSQNSNDLDCMVFLEDIPTKNNSRSSNGYKKSIQTSHDLCDFYAKKIKELTKTKKEVNVNICSLKDGIVHRVFKGTPDEVNNSCYLTYAYHNQRHLCQIKRLVKRDVEIKILRTCRVILSFWSRSKYRTEVKSALKGDIYEKIKVIDKIDPVGIELNKNISDGDYAKTMAFQLAQTILLIDGIEIYTKYEVEDYLWELTENINRIRDDKEIKNFKDLFISKIRNMSFNKIYE
jgi:hypothetical protein